MKGIEKKGKFINGFGNLNIYFCT